MFICKYCGKEFYRKDERFNKFCSSSCSAKFNNQKRRKPLTNCINCGKEISKKGYRDTKIKFCSNSCQSEKRYKENIEKWLAGEISGAKGKGDYQITKWVRKYLLEKSDYKCSQCGWSKINPYTGKVPLDIDHIDGNWRNNRPENLIVLCGCCHSLTSTYRALNSGKGRGSEMRGSRLYKKIVDKT